MIARRAIGVKATRWRASRSVVALLAAWLTWCGAVAAAQMDVYEGLIGAGGVGGAGSPVVLELGKADAQGVRQGRYFYRRYGVDIPLRGLPGALAEAVPLRDTEPNNETPTDQQVAVFADPATQQPRAIWQGRLVGEHYRGEWRDTRSGKSLPFDLTRLARYDVKPDEAAPFNISRDSAPYDFLRLNTPMKAGKEVVQGRVGYRMVTDARTRFAYPQLTRHPNAAVLAKTNQILEQRHWAMNQEALACASTLYTDRGPAAGSLANYDKESVVVDYLSPSLMSVVESGSTYCGGAHPNNHFEPFTLDLLRGGYLDFSRIVKAGKKGEYETQYSNALVRLAQRGVQNKVKGAERPANSVNNDEFDCTEIWPQNLQLHFKAPDLLAFDTVGVLHATSNCQGTHLTLNFAALRPVLAPGAARYLSVAP